MKKDSAKQIKNNDATKIPTSKALKSKIIKTDVGEKNGQKKCPKCGATDVIFNIKKGKLICSFCRHEFIDEKISELETDISKLEGHVMTSGAKNISADSNDIITLKCESCAAEVVIDTSEALQARCHWCRNTLSINTQIDNGAIADVVLPFAITKEEAENEIKKFVSKRKFFAHPIFKKEFTTENIMGVYFPYMIVDINAYANFKGKGEILKRKYVVGTNENRKIYYDADLYEVQRSGDIIIHGLSIESSKDKLNQNASDKTTNIINAIMPFDVENCIKWDANYLKGFSSEKRDINIEDLQQIVNLQSKDIARFKTNESLLEYNRGVAWDTQDLEIKGQQWKAAYLPVWLYSYQQGNKKLHYVAVNARTKETMGSVPIHMPKLIFISSLIEFLGIIAMFFVDSDYGYLFMLVGIIYFLIIYLRYRNSNARHKHEIETKTEIKNIKKVDNFIKTQTRLRNSKIKGINNDVVQGSNNKDNISSFLNKITED